MRILKKTFWASCRNIRPLVLNLPRDICAGIGPLQLGVVLVSYITDIVSHGVLPIVVCQFLPTITIEYQNIALGTLFGSRDTS